MLIERTETVKRIEEKFRGMVEINRDIISSRRGLPRYPQHVRNVLSERGPDSLPYIFVEGQLVSAGNFPSYEEFLMLLNPYLEKAEARKRV